MNWINVPLPITTSTLAIGMWKVESLTLLSVHLRGLEIFVIKYNDKKETLLYK